MPVTNLVAHPYKDPWELPAQVRLQALLANKPRVAYYYEEPNNSSFRYRAYNMVQALGLGDQPWGAAYFFATDFEIFDVIADYADILVVCRSGMNQSLSTLQSKFRSRGKPVGFDVDDLVFNPLLVPQLIQVLGQDPKQNANWDYWFAYCGRMQQSLLNSDFAIATNQRLADQLAVCIQGPVHVLPNFMNHEQLSYSEQVFKNRVQRTSASEPFRIGYFSGSPSHNRDFEIVHHQIVTLASEYPNVELTIAGYLDIGLLPPSFRKQIRTVPFTDWVNLQRLVGEVDLNLVPLQRSLFSDCKSELKYFESAAVGVPTLASPSYTYAAAIQHGNNGMLALEYQWKTVLAELLESPALANDLGARARTGALATYSPQVQRGAIASLFEKYL